jgi:multiple sugar transport system substrate-binding protein
MPKFDNGRNLDLTKRFASSKAASRAVFWPNDYERAVWGGKQYLLPQFDNPAVIYYHTGLFQKRGVASPPDKPGAGWTWATFLDTARRLTSPSEGTFGFTQNEWWVYLEPWVWMNGGDFLSKDRKQVILDQPAGLEAIAFAVDTRGKHRVNPQPADIQAAGNVDTMFYAGNLGMSLNICNWTDTVRRQPGVPWNIAPAPQGPKSYTPRSPATMWAMWSETKQSDRAFELFEHFASPEVHRQIPMVPSRRDVSESGQFMFATTIPGLRWQVFVDAKKAARDDPSTAAFQDMDRLMKAEQGKLWQGQSTPKEFVAAFKGSVEQFLAEAERSGAK